MQKLKKGSVHLAKRFEGYLPKQCHQITVFLMIKLLKYTK